MWLKGGGGYFSVLSASSHCIVAAPPPPPPPFHLHLPPLPVFQPTQTPTSQPASQPASQARLVNLDSCGKQTLEEYYREGMHGEGVRAILSPLHACL